MERILRLYDIDERRLPSSLVDKLRKDASPIGFESPSTKRMRRIEQIAGLFGRSAKCFPGHAALPKRIDKSNFKKVKEAQCKLTVDRWELTLPNGSRRVLLTRVLKRVTTQ